MIWRPEPEPDPEPAPPALGASCRRASKGEAASGGLHPAPAAAAAPCRRASKGEAAGGSLASATAGCCAACSLESERGFAGWWSPPAGRGSSGPGQVGPAGCWPRAAGAGSGLGWCCSRARRSTTSRALGRLAGSGAMHCTTCTAQRAQPSAPRTSCRAQAAEGRHAAGRQAGAARQLHRAQRTQTQRPPQPPPSYGKPSACYHKPSRP